MTDKHTVDSDSNVPFTPGEEDDIFVSDMMLFSDKLYYQFLFKQQFTIVHLN